MSGRDVLVTAKVNPQRQCTGVTNTWTGCTVMTNTICVTCEAAVCGRHQGRHRCERTGTNR